MQDNTDLNNLPPPPPEDTISDVYVPDKRGQLIADAWKQTHNLRVDMQNGRYKKQASNKD